MSYEGKTGTELTQLMMAKNDECHAIFAAHETSRDGEKMWDLTVAQLEDINARQKEINEIGAARDKVLNTEQKAKFTENLKAELGEPQRPNFGGTAQPATGQNRPVYVWSGGEPPKGIGEQFVQSKAYQDFLQNHSTGAESDSVVIEAGFKTLMTTSTGWPPEAVRSGVVVPYATRQPVVTDFIPTISISQNAYVYMEETTFTNAAVETAEGSAKPEAALALTERTVPVRKIAVWIPATDEQLEDVVGMQAYIEQRLGFMVQQRLASQICVGTGVTPNLTGVLAATNLQTQAKGADPTPDAIYKAMTKVRVTGQAVPSLYVTHPNDWQEVKLLRTTDGIYIWGSPSEAGPDRIWGLPVVQEIGMTEGTGVVGDFANYSLLAERKGLTIKVGFQNDDFIKNQRSIVAEIRCAMVWLRGSAFCSVTGI